MIELFSNVTFLCIPEEYTLGNVTLRNKKNKYFLLLSNTNDASNTVESLSYVFKRCLRNTHSSLYVWRIFTVYKAL